MCIGSCGSFFGDPHNFDIHLTKKHMVLSQRIFHRDEKSHWQTFVETVFCERNPVPAHLIPHNPGLHITQEMCVVDPCQGNAHLTCADSWAKSRDWKFEFILGVSDWLSICLQKVISEKWGYHHLSFPKQNLALLSIESWLFKKGSI